MSQDLKPITPDSRLIKTLTCIPEKFIVDFANGIDISRDHLRVQRERDGFFKRCFDGFTGNTARRQTEINASLANAVEGSLTWLTELSRGLAHSNYAIMRVNDRVTELMSHVTILANYSHTTRQQLNDLAQELDERLFILNKEVVDLDYKQKVIICLDQVFYKWTAGHFNAYSPAGRCYAAIEELRWGAFGDYCCNHKGSERNNFLEQAVNRATTLLAKDAEIAINSRLSVYDNWLKLPHSKDQNRDWHDALTYIADDFEIESAPLVTTITQKLPTRLGSVPILANALRLAETMVDEVFMGPDYV